MAEISVDGPSREPGYDELRLDFPPNPAFIKNHGILIPSLVGSVIGHYRDKQAAYLPCRDENDAFLLGGASVIFSRLAKYEDTFYVDVRDSEQFWKRMPQIGRPTLGAKDYFLPRGGPNTDAAVFRNLIVADIERASWDLIAEFDNQQNAPQEQESDLGLADFFHEDDNPFIQVRSLARVLREKINNNPAVMLQDLFLLHKDLDPVVEQLRLLDHLQTMDPHAKDQALKLPPDKVWAAIDLYMKRMPRFAGHSELDSGAAGGGV